MILGYGCMCVAFLMGLYQKKDSFFSLVGLCKQFFLKKRKYLDFVYGIFVNS